MGPPKSAPCSPLFVRFRGVATHVSDCAFLISNSEIRIIVGFPCQPFSVRGQTPGLSDERGQLFRELVRLLTACQPSAFLFENVAGLVVRTRLKIGFAVLYVRLCVLIVWQIIDGGHRTRHPDNKGGSRQRTEGPTDVFSEGPTFRHIIAAFVRPFVA